MFFVNHCTKTTIVTQILYFNPHCLDHTFNTSLPQIFVLTTTYYKYFIQAHFHHIQLFLQCCLLSKQIIPHNKYLYWTCLVWNTSLPQMLQTKTLQYNFTITNWWPNNFTQHKIATNVANSHKTIIKFQKCNIWDSFDYLSLMK